MSLQSKVLHLSFMVFPSMYRPHGSFREGVSMSSVLIFFLPLPIGRQWEYFKGKCSCTRNNFELCYKLLAKAISEKPPTPTSGFGCGKI